MYQLGRKDPTFVYFMGTVDGQFVKIGCSSKPEKRLNFYAHWSPIHLEMLGYFPGQPIHERAVHAFFGSFHSHREWFHLVPAITTFVESCRRSGSLPIEDLPLDLKKNPLPTKRSNWRAGAS